MATLPPPPARPVAGARTPSPTGRGWRPTGPQSPLPTGLAAEVSAPARALGRTLRSAVDAVVLLAVLAFAALAVGPHVLPYRPVTMLTGSMAPAIPAGSVLIGTFVPPQDVRAGDVITMKAPEGDLGVVTHRVTEVQRRGDAVLVRTRGDGNSTPDPWLAQLDGDVLRASAALPWIGHPLAALQGSTGHAVLTRLVPGLLVMVLLVSVWRRPTAPQARLTAVHP